jgi:hypothetical protein
VITSDAGLPAYPELGDLVGLTGMAGNVLADARTGRNGRHALVGLLRQSVFGRLAGYEDVNDAERLCRDPAMRWVVGDQAVYDAAASTSEIGRFETECLTRPENLAALTNLCGQWIDRVHRRRPPKLIVLDMDSSESPTYGEREGSAHNGHFGCTCHHPLFLFNQFGDLERCTMRPGNVHLADGWRGVLEPVVSRYRRGKTVRLYFRGDAAFANPEIYEFLEAEGMDYTIPSPRQWRAARQDRVLAQASARAPPNEVRRFHASFSHQAQSWKKPRRVVVKVEWHQGELYPRVGLDPLRGSSVTNLTRPTERVVAFYNQRGTCEQWVKEGKRAIKWTRLSCQSFPGNAVRLQLHALAFNLGNFMRTLAMHKAVEPWSLTSLREKLIKVGAKVVRHGRYVVFQMAEVAIPRQMFQEIFQLIAELRPPPPPAPA